MADRPYINHSAVQLEAEAKKHWHSVQALTEVLEELKHRTTARAQRVERDVVQRVLDLNGMARPEPGHDGRGAYGRSPGREGGPSDDGKIRELTMRAVRAEQRVRELEDKLRSGEADVARARSARGDERAALYAKVGLHPSCPEFVLKVVRRAYRKEYHPDMLSDQPRADQLSAQERFKEYEGVFEQIERQAPD